MKIKWETNGKEYNITNFITKATWGGSAKQGGRKIEFGVVYSPHDKNIDDINIKLGDRVKLYEEGKLLIDAMIYSRERISEQGEVTFAGYDDMNRLCEGNTTFAINNTTPENIASKMCSEMKIPKGNIAVTNTPINLIIDGETPYAAIMKSYTKAHKKNGKHYTAIMIGRKLHVIEKGEIIDSFMLSDKTNIVESTFTETIEGMINRVKIYNDKQVQVGEVVSQNNLDKFGIFQDTYTIEEGVNFTTVAKSMLEGIKKESSITALGNIDCISGYGINIKDKFTGLTGTFWIENDEHTWENKTYTMTLDLAFKNIMDIHEEDSTTTKDKKKKSKSNKKKSLADTTDITVVYIANASTKYHSYSTCSGMKDAEKLTKGEAIKKKKGNCSRCWY